MKFYTRHVYLIGSLLLTQRVLCNLRTYLRLRLFTTMSTSLLKAPIDQYLLFISLNYSLNYLSSLSGITVPNTHQTLTAS